MKHIMLRLGLICAILVAIAQTASGQCSSKTIQGTYGFIIEGAGASGVFSGVPAVQIGVITFDGAGHHSGVTWLTYGGSGVLPAGQLIGEQTVYPDCRFVGKHFDEQGNISATFEGTITGTGVLEELHFVVTYVAPPLPPAVLYGTDYKISPKACSLSTLQGAYTFSGRGTITSDTPPSLAVREGIFNFDGKGNFSGRARVITSISTLPVPPETSDNFPDTFAGTYAVNTENTDCMALLSVTSSTSSVFGLITEMGAITRDNKQFQEIDVMITDPGFAFAERIRKQ